MSETATKHRWKFFRYGGIDQVSLETAEDLKNLEQLDPKLWAAMTCPTQNIEFDSRTLDLIDTDKDKRIKIPELLAALKWICGILKNPAVIIKPAKALPLDEINPETAEGKALLASARQILANIGKSQETAISLEELVDTHKIFASTTFNGDGIVPVDAAASEAAKKLIAEIIDCMGGDEDRSGKTGVSEARLDAFLAEAAAFSAWVKKSEDDAVSIMFAGNDTAALAELFSGVELRIDDYFIRCRLADFDAKYVNAAAALENDYIALLKKSLSSATAELKELPLAIAGSSNTLFLTEKVNPAWAGQLAAFASKIAGPFGGDAQKLSEEQWLKIKEKFAPYKAWLAQKAGSAVEKLGVARVRDILSGNLEKEVRDLIARDKAVAAEFEAIVSVEKLVRYYLYLYQLLNNFVVFKDFYDSRFKAVFQYGMLFMDSRSCDLCVKVEDIAKHSSMAASCYTFLVYCDCVRQGSSEKTTIAAAFTDGDSDQLLPGRNGLFVDRKGNYWDATIVKVIDHPISIRQAFWAPYKRLGRMIQEQIEKFAASKDKSVSDSLAAGVSDAGAKLETPKKDAPPPAPFDVGKFAGIFAAIGLAMAAIGSAIASIISGFMALAWWQMPLAVIGVLLLISGPSMLLAAMRLRQRNLGAILDANGWAVNTRAQINMAFGKTLTHMAELPKGSVHSFDDPFAEKKRPWKLYLVLLLILAVIFACFASPRLRGRLKNRIMKAVGCEVKKPALPKTGPKTAKKDEVSVAQPAKQAKPEVAAPATPENAPTPE